jgi:hypothetical protein
MQRVKEFCDNLDKYSRGEGVKFQDLVDKAKSLNKKFFQHLVISASREINRSDFGGRFAIKSYIILKITKQAASEIFGDSLMALTAINSILTTSRNSVIKFEKKYKDKLKLLRRRKITKKDLDLDDAEKYDRFVGENVILTTWDGAKQKVKIIKNDKQGKKLLVDGGHVLIYTNIGEGRAVTAIEIDNEDSEDLGDDDPEPDVVLAQSKKIREWLRNKYGKDWWQVDADEKKRRKKEARIALSKPEKPPKSKPKKSKSKSRKPKPEKSKPNKTPRKRKLKPPPSLLDPLRLFYTSLYKENPESSMAIEWLTKHSLYKDGQLVEGIEE